MNQFSLNRIKLLIVTLSLVLIFSLVSFPVIQASAATNGFEKTEIFKAKEEIINSSTELKDGLTNANEFKTKEEIVSKSIEFKNGKYQINEDSIKNGELTKHEITQVNKYFENLSPTVLETINSDVLNTSSNDYLETPPGEVSTYLLPVVVVAFLGTLAIFVGWELASSITSDFYTWGVKSGCKKWKKQKVVKSFCKANGYL